MSEFHVDVVRLGEVLPHPNADLLEITNVHGGYPCIIRKGDFKPGDLAVYVPIDTTLPDIECFSFLADRDRKHLRAKKLRGIFSMGLIIPPPEGVSEGDDVAELLGVTKWEAGDDPNVTGGECEPPPQGWHFPHYTDLDALRRRKWLLVPGEEVVITEKIHGANARYVHDGERLWVGSRKQIKVEDPASIWWKAAAQCDLAEKLAQAPMHVFFGEVFGQVQDLKYGVNGVAFRCFDVFDVSAGRYLDHDEARFLADDLGIEWVPLLYRGPWEPENVDTWCEGFSAIEGANHVREGFVVKPVRERYDERVGRVILKMHGQGYLLRKGK